MKLVAWHLASAIALAGPGCSPAAAPAPETLQHVLAAETTATIGSETRLCSGARGRILHYGDFASAADLPEFVRLGEDLGRGERIVLTRRVWRRSNGGRSTEPTLRSAAVSVDRTQPFPRARLADLGTVSGAGPVSVQIMAFPLLSPATREISAEITVPEGGVLAFGYGVREEAAAQGGGPVAFAVSARTAGEPEKDLFTATLGPDAGNAQRWHEARVDLSAYQGRRLELRFSSRRTRAEAGAAAGFSLPVFCDPVVYPVPRRDPRPNVVLISLDTLRARSLGSYGYERDTSPFLDSLAARGALFENAITTSVTTSPAHMSMFTGLYPVHHGIREGLDRKSPHVVTLARQFRNAGYQTAAFTENGYLVRKRGFGEGFSTYTENIGRERKAPGEARRTFGQARRWLAENRDAPFLLFIHTYEVHSPYDPEGKYTDLFRDDGAAGPDDPAVREARDRYDREIRVVDDEIARFFAALEEAGLAEETIVAIVSDHGEEFAEHGGYQHGGSVFEESVRVPLIFVAPGRIRGPQRHALPVSLVDVTPTLLDLAGVVPITQVDGASLRGLLEDGSAPAERTIFSEARASKRWIDPLRHEVWNPPLLALRRGDDKFIVHRPEHGPAAPMLRFDLATDPHETRPLPIKPDRAREIEVLLSRYLGAKSTLPATTDDEVSPELRERLRALGYAE
jgi:arylsulfatase A-like enzyme